MKQQEEERLGEVGEAAVRLMAPGISLPSRTLPWAPGGCSCKKPMSGEVGGAEGQFPALVQVGELGEPSASQLRRRKDRTGIVLEPGKIQLRPQDLVPPRAQRRCVRGG